MVLEPGAKFDHFTHRGPSSERAGWGRYTAPSDVRLERRVALKILPPAHHRRRRSRAGPHQGGSAGHRGRGEGPRSPRSHPRRHALDRAERRRHPARGPGRRRAPRPPQRRLDLRRSGSTTARSFFLAMEPVAGTPLRAFIGRAGVLAEQRLRWLVTEHRAGARGGPPGRHHRPPRREARKTSWCAPNGVVEACSTSASRGARSSPSPPGRTSPRRQVRRASISASVFAGTPARSYGARAGARGHRVDGRTDQFAWGTVAFELLTGRKPWGTEEGVPETPLRRRPSRSSILPRLRSVPPAIEAVVLARWRRPPTIASRRWRSRRPLPRLGRRVGDLALGAFPGAGSWLRTRPRRARSPGPSPRPGGTRATPRPRPSRSSSGTSSPTRPSPSTASPIQLRLPSRSHRCRGRAPPSGASDRSRSARWQSRSSRSRGPPFCPRPRAPGVHGGRALHGRVPPGHAPRPAGTAELRALGARGVRRRHARAPRGRVGPGAMACFERAAAADPGCAEAQLRLVLTAPRATPVARVREAYVRAQGRRASLLRRTGQAPPRRARSPGAPGSWPTRGPAASSSAPSPYALPGRRRARVPGEQLLPSSRPRRPRSPPRSAPPRPSTRATRTRGR